MDFCLQYFFIFILFFGMLRTKSISFEIGMIFVHCNNHAHSKIDINVQKDV